MAAVFRVKRRLDEEPSETLILNCKKRKKDLACSTTDLSTVLKFAGTVNKEENIVQHIKKHTIQDAKLEYKKHLVNVSDKLRAIKQEESKNARYKIVSCFRGETLKESPEADKEQENYTIYDIETDCKENDGNVANLNNKVNFVYDLYYTNSDDLGDVNLDEYVSVCPLEDPLFFGSARDNGLNKSDTDEDSEDSNTENNWRNDYPDESDLESVNEEDMVEAMQKCELESSSDSGEEGFVYSIDSEGAGFEEDIDDSDVQRYGERYARFKARHKDKEIETNGLKQDFYYGDIDEEEYYY